MEHLVRVLFIILTLTFTGYHSKAQGIHFSQAYSAHLTLNPANTGRYNGDWRAVGIFRQQGYHMGNDYQTTYFSFENPFYVKEEKLDVGLYYSRDNSAGNTFPVDRINLSAGHGIRINHLSYLHAGVQIAWVHKQINMNGLSFPDQYNRVTGGFDPTQATAEQLENNRTTYPDAGIGVVYARTLPIGIISAGYSVQQINRPKESFFGVDKNLPMKHIWHSKGDIGINNKLFLIPAIIYTREGNSQMSLAGLNMGYNLDHWLNQYNSVIAGIHLRNATIKKSQSLIISGGINWQYWTFMLAFDTDISKARSNSITGSGLEMSVIYKLPSTSITQKMIQWERY
jgi:type IX secretion system PorP/SprF family membrane protein